MKCPRCNEEIQEENRRIKLDHPFSESKKTQKDKTKLARIWYCHSCNKYFGAVLKLAEVALA